MADAPTTGHTVQNWAKTYSAQPAEWWEPASVSDVRVIIRRCSAAGRTLRVVGNACSPNDCAMSDDAMMSLRRLNRVLALDVAAGVGKVEAGLSLSALNEALDRNGLALENLASISDQSIAGAIGTGTHGTGLGLGILATNVLEMQLVDAAGDVHVLSRALNPGALASNIKRTVANVFQGQLVPCAMCRPVRSGAVQLRVPGCRNRHRAARCASVRPVRRRV